MMSKASPQGPLGRIRPDYGAVFKTFDKGRPCGGVELLFGDLPSVHIPQTCSTPVGRFQELENRFRHLVVLNKAAAQFVRDVYGHVTRPAFSRIESNDPDRILV